MPRPKKPSRLIAVHVRLFREDVKALKDRASKNALPWNIELRQLVRRALKGETREFHIIKE